MNIMVNVPDEYFLNTTVEEMAKELKVSTALLMFQAGKISAGAACEFAGIDRYDFLAACKKHGIEVLQYSKEELEADLCTIQRAMESC